MRRAYFVSLVAVPVLMQALLVVLTRAVAASAPSFDDVGFVTPVVSSLTGLLLLARHAQRAQIIVIGVFYIPVMYVLLMYCSLIFVGNIYGDWL